MTPRLSHKNYTRTFPRRFLSPKHFCSWTAKELLFHWLLFCSGSWKFNSLNREHIEREVSTRVRLWFASSHFGIHMNNVMNSFIWNAHCIRLLIIFNSWWSHKKGKSHGAYWPYLRKSSYLVSLLGTCIFDSSLLEFDNLSTCGWHSLLNIVCDVKIFNGTFWKVKMETETVKAYYLSLPPRITT